MFITALFVILIFEKIDKSAIAANTKDGESYLYPPYYFIISLYILFFNNNIFDGGGVFC